MCELLNHSRSKPGSCFLRTRRRFHQTVPQPVERLNQLVRFANREFAQQALPQRFALPPEFLAHLATGGRERDAAGAAIGGVRLPFDKTAFFQQHKHRPQGIRLGRRALNQFPLRDGLPSGQRVQHHELIGCDSRIGEGGIGLPVHDGYAVRSAMANRCAATPTSQSR